MIPNYTIYSDKVMLTANYYIEYLGFSLLYKVEEDDNPYVWLELNNQFVLIWPWNNKLGIAKPVELEVPDILEYYIRLSERTRINVPLSLGLEGQKKFSVLDCEDNVIQFIEQPSSAIYVPDGMASDDFASDVEKKSVLEQ